MTFPTPEVLAALEPFARCKLDIDHAANREVCAQYAGTDGVPTFVVLAPDGHELERWVGALPAADFVAKLAAATDTTAQRLLAAAGDDAAIAQIHAERGDIDAALRHLDAIVGDSAEANATRERIGWLLCQTLRGRQRWRELERAAQHYLATCADGEHRRDAEVAAALAQYAATGTAPPPLTARIDELLAVLGEPFPERSLRDRVARFFGSPNLASEQAQDNAAGAWCERMNASMDELQQLGNAALPALHRALQDGDERTMDHAATVIGWIRAPQSRPFLCELLQRGDLDLARRAAVVRSLGMHKNATDLPRMLALARSSEAPLVRAEAVEAIRDLAMQTDGTADPEVAAVLAATLRHRDCNLRTWVLQAMFEVKAPLPLDGLLAAMQDERATGFPDCNICDDALWVFLQQIGSNLRDGGQPIGQHCTPEIRAFLQQWYGEVRARLRWDEQVRHWVVDPPPPNGR